MGSLNQACLQQRAELAARAQLLQVVKSAERALQVEGALVAVVVEHSDSPALASRPYIRNALWSKSLFGHAASHAQ